MSKKEKVYECNIECRMCDLGCLFDVLYNGEWRMEQLDFYWEIQDGWWYVIDSEWIDVTE